MPPKGLELPLKWAHFEQKSDPRAQNPQMKKKLGLWGRKYLLSACPIEKWKANSHGLLLPKEPISGLRIDLGHDYHLDRDTPRSLKIAFWLRDPHVWRASETSAGPKFLKKSEHLAQAEHFEFLSCVHNIKTDWSHSNAAQRSLGRIHGKTADASFNKIRSSRVSRP